jgi:hypothetical protein
MWGMDGEVLQIIMPSEEEVNKLVSTTEKHYRTSLGNTASSRLCASLQLLLFFFWLRLHINLAIF